jgi:hypothetical protein
VRPGVTVVGVIACPTCGADRLLPLHFPRCRRDEKAEIIIRPIAKCAGCGARIYTRPELSQTNAQPWQ